MHSLPAEYRDHFLRQAAAIRERLADFRSVPRSEYIWELLYCLLTPQSRARNAEAVIATLRERDFLDRPFDPTSVLRDPAHYIRFHNQKARRLVAVAENNAEIRSALETDMTSEQKRAWLVANVNGLGWKEASHFLRNIGCLDLAIIDRHILKHLLRTDAIDSIPASIGTKRVYLDLEQRFRHLADRCGLSLQELDLLFWSYEEGSVRK